MTNPEYIARYREIWEYCNKKGNEHLVSIFEKLIENEKRRDEILIELADKIIDYPMIWEMHLAEKDLEKLEIAQNIYRNEVSLEPGDDRNTLCSFLEDKLGYDE